MSAGVEIVVLPVIQGEPARPIWVLPKGRITRPAKSWYRFWVPSPTDTVRVVSAWIGTARG